MAPQDTSRKLTLLTDVKVGDGRKDIQGLTKDYVTLDKTASEFSKRVGRYFETGERAADDARKSVSEMQRALAKANNEWGDPSSVQVARSRAAAFRDELEEAQHLLDVQEQRVRVEEQINNAQRGRPGESTPDRFQSAGDVSTGLSAAAALLPGGAGNAVRGAADAAGLIEQLPKLSAGLAGVGLSVGTVLAVAAPLAIAFAGVAYVLEKAEKANRAYLATEEEIARLRIAGTSEDAQAQLLAAQEELAVAQARIQDIYKQKFSQPVNLENFIATLGGSGGLDKALEDAQQQAAEASTKIDVLNQELEKGTFAANDAAEAEKRLTEERTRATILEIQAAADRRLEAERLKAEGTSDQVEARLDAIERERNAIEGQIEDLNSLVGTTEEGRAQIAALEIQLSNLTAEERLLRDEVLGVVRAREGEIEAIEAYTAAMEKAQTQAEQLVQSQEQFNDAIEQLDEQTAARREQIIEQSAKRILDIEQKLADNIASAMRDAERADDAALRELNDEIAAVNQEAADQEIELRQETADRINDLEQRAAIERQRILRDYNRAASKAIQDRDAVALDQAQQTRNDGLREAERQLDEGVREEKEALQQRLEEQQRSNAQRLRDLQISYEQEQRERAISLQQRLNDLRQSAANEIAVTRQNQAEALAELTRAYNQQKQTIVTKFAEQFTAISGHYTKLNTLTTTSLNALYAKWVDHFNKVAAAQSEAITESSSSSTTQGHEDGPGNLGGYASGTKSARRGWSWVGENGPELRYMRGGEAIYSNRDSMRMASGMNVTMGEGAIVINTQSSDARGVMREVRRELPDMMADVLERLARD